MHITIQTPFSKCSLLSVFRTTPWNQGSYLIGDFDEKTCHSLWSIVVSGYRVYHTDSINHARYTVQHLHRTGSLQRLAEFHQCVQILHVIFSFIGSIRDPSIERFPLFDYLAFSSEQDTNSSLTRLRFDLVE